MNLSTFRGQLPIAMWLESLDVPTVDSTTGLLDYSVAAHHTLVESAFENITIWFEVSARPIVLSFIKVTFIAEGRVDLGAAEAVG